MRAYTVLWRDRLDTYQATVVRLPGSCIPASLHPDDWADLASATEYLMECQATSDGILDTPLDPEPHPEYLPSRDGYQMILVAAGQVEIVL